MLKYNITGKCAMWTAFKHVTLKAQSSGNVKGFVISNQEHVNISTDKEDT
jgi:hypothetical protein